MLTTRSFSRDVYVYAAWMILIYNALWLCIRIEIVCIRSRVLCMFATISSFLHLFSRNALCLSSSLKTIQKAAPLLLLIMIEIEFS